MIGIAFFRYQDGKFGDYDVSLESGKKAYDEGFYDAVRLIADIIDKKENGDKLISFVKNSQDELKEYTAKISGEKKENLYGKSKLPNLWKWEISQYFI
ncbi:MAG: hypothetical protein MR902_06410 [Campylobacter sp.]|nr:hypothetical protein [Campylobacter sp.]